MRTTAGLVPLVLLLAACGSQHEDASNHRSGNRPGAASPSVGAVEVVYEGRGRSSDGPIRAHIDVVLGGEHQARVSFMQTGMSQMLYVWDGLHLLVHDPEGSRPWTLYEAAGEHPEQLQAVTSWRSTPGSASFEQTCRAARVVGHKTVLGRRAVGYHCGARHYSDGSSESASVVWLDQATGLLLQAGGLHATSIDESPAITDATFSTTPPPGAEVERHAAKKPFSGGGKAAPDFRLKRLDLRSNRQHGSAALADYAGKPLVLAFFASDIVFDTSGEECGRCAPSLLALQRETAGGTSPSVLAIQVGEWGKPGYPLVPDGLRLDVANDPTGDVQLSYGLSGWVGFAFVGSDGTVRQLFDKPPTDRQLQEALDALN
jgi:peroxiredoxin